MKIIQVTDLHLVTPGETLCGLDPLARFSHRVARWSAFWRIRTRALRFEFEGERSRRHSVRRLELLQCILCC
jgi:hypothetical protein